MVVYVLCYGARINVFSVVVLFGDLPLSSLLELGIMFIVGAWALVTTQRNWRRRKSR